MLKHDKKILCVGTVCYDIINVVKYFPIEDTQMRTVEQRRSRGGNASNTTTVLSHLKFPCEFLGSLTSDISPDAKFVEEDFQRHDIACDMCPRHCGYSLPNSCIIVNRETGSRTILHTNDGLPELTVNDFCHTSPNNYCWVHLEGRPNAQNLQEIAKMIKNKWPHIPISLEMEKPERARRGELASVLPYIDLLFISKECASSLGADCMAAGVTLFNSDLPAGACVVCPWGEKGAAAKDGKGTVFEVSSYPPPSGKITRHSLIKYELVNTKTKNSRFIFISSGYKWDREEMF